MCNRVLCKHLIANNFLSLQFQITYTMVALWHHLRRARRSKFWRYGLLNNHIIPDATLCYHINCLFPVEDEQNPRTYNVCVIFCVRRRFAVIRVRLRHMSTLKRISERSESIHSVVIGRPHNNVWGQELKKKKLE